MRDLTQLELQAVAGGRMVPTQPRIDIRRLVVAIIRRILDPRRPDAPKVAT